VWLSGGVSLSSWHHTHRGAGHQNSSGTTPGRTKSTTMPVAQSHPGSPQWWWPCAQHYSQTFNITNSTATSDHLLLHR